MEFQVDIGHPRGLPPKAAARFDRLGYGQVVDRRTLVASLGSRRAADQFIHTWANRGLLVPRSWGSYWIPKEPHAFLVLLARPASQARLLSWAATLPRRFAFMSPVLWEKGRISVDSPSPLLPLRPAQRRLEPQAPQWQAFAADLGWPPEPLTITVGDHGRVRSRAVCAADVAWILRLNKDPRTRQAGTSLLRGVPRPERERALDIRRRAAFPAWTPTRSRSLALPVGPPGQFRLFAPRWYMGPHHHALEAEDRRSADA